MLQIKNILSFIALLGNMFENLQDWYEHEWPQANGIKVVNRYKYYRESKGQIFCRWLLKIFLLYEHDNFIISIGKAALIFLREWFGEEIKEMLWLHLKAISLDVVFDIFHKVKPLSTSASDGHHWLRMSRTGIDNILFLQTLKNVLEHLLTFHLLWPMASFNAQLLVITSLHKLS